MVKALLRGRHGNGVLMMDAGRREKRCEDGIETDTGVPDHLLPQRIPEHERRALRRRLRPDALVYTKGNGKEPGVLHVIEVKYCKDTDRTVQEKRATEQHRELVALLEAAGHKTKLQVITLGVGGTIYKNMKEQLDELGVEGSSATGLMEELSIYAIQQMYAVVQVRRQKEAEARAAKGGQRPTRVHRDPWEPRGRRKRDGVG